MDGTNGKSDWPKGVGGKIFVPPLTISRAALLKDGSDREFRRLVHGLFAFFSLHETVRSGHAAYIGLPGIQYTILISIGHLAAAGPVSIKTVAEHLRFSGSFITVETGKLVKRGLVRKVRDAGDRRRVSLSVTDAGRALLEMLAPVQRRVNDAQFECLGDGDLGRLVALVEALIGCGERAVALQKYLTKHAHADAQPDGAGEGTATKAAE